MNAKLVSNRVHCLSLVMFFVTCITSVPTEAASYQKTDGTIVDPIRLIRSGFVHSYSGANLEPYAKISDAKLRFANLIDANLRYSNLVSADPSSLLWPYSA